MVPTMETVDQRHLDDLARLASEASGWRNRANRERIEAEMWRLQTMLLTDIVKNTNPPSREQRVRARIERLRDSFFPNSIAFVAVGLSLLLAASSGTMRDEAQLLQIAAFSFVGFAALVTTTEMISVMIQLVRLIRRTRRGAGA